MEFKEILKKLGFDPESITVNAFRNEEDGEEYSVWKIVSGTDTFVLKEAKGYELKIYEKILSHADSSFPRLISYTEDAGKDYLLLEYVKGEPLLVCDRQKLTLALDALISIQKAYWEKSEFDGIGQSTEKALVQRKRRGEFLCDAELEHFYGIYLELFSSKQIPKTLCHDDLLPFNILVSKNEAAVIDWETAGMLPYPTSLSRFLAHTEDRKSVFFYMSADDYEFAIRYYYENLVKEHGISYGEYRSVLDYFIFYEYTEWIMLGNRYEDADTERFERYYKLAKDFVRKLDPEIIGR